MDIEGNRWFKLVDIPDGFVESVEPKLIDPRVVVECVQLERAQREAFYAELGEIDLDNLDSTQLKRVILDGYDRARSDAYSASLVETKRATFKPEISTLGEKHE